jgi:hypothetical protein
MGESFPSDRKAMKISFQLKKRREQNLRGLTMLLVPGLPEDRSARAEAIVLDEAAFGFIEPCIREYWPAYSGYAHWGITSIPVDTWRNIAWAMLVLRDRLLVESSPDAVSGIGFIVPEARAAFYEDFEAVRSGIVEMITELVAWLESKMPICSHISIFGV